MQTERIEGWKWVKVAWHDLGLTADPDGGNVEAYGDELYVPDRLRVLRTPAPGVTEEIDLLIEEGGKFGMTGHRLSAADGRLIPLSWVAGLGLEHHARLAIAKEVVVQSGFAQEEDMPEDVAADPARAFVWELSGEPVYSTVEEGDPRARTARKALRSQVGRPPVEEEELREAVRIYLATPHAPLREIERRMGLSYRTAARRIEMARERGVFDAMAAEGGDANGER